MIGKFLKQKHNLVRDQCFHFTPDFAKCHKSPRERIKTKAIQPKIPNQQPSCASPETLTESKITEWDLKIAQKNLNKKQNQAAVRIYFMKDFRFIINGDFL